MTRTVQRARRDLRALMTPAIVAKRKLSAREDRRRIALVNEIAALAHQRVTLIGRKNGSSRSRLQRKFDTVALALDGLIRWRRKGYTAFWMRDGAAAELRFLGVVDVNVPGEALRDTALGLAAQRSGA